MDRITRLTTKAEALEAAAEEYRKFGAAEAIEETLEMAAAYRALIAQEANR